MSDFTELKSNVHTSWSNGAKTWMTYKQRIRSNERNWFVSMKWASRSVSDEESTREGGKFILPIPNGIANITNGNFNYVHVILPMHWHISLLIHINSQLSCG